MGSPFLSLGRSWLRVALAAAFAAAMSFYAIHYYLRPPTAGLDSSSGQPPDSHTSPKSTKKHQTFAQNNAKYLIFMKSTDFN
jgi:hypothetical protein